MALRGLSYAALIGVTFLTSRTLLSDATLKAAAGEGPEFSQEQVARPTHGDELGGEGPLPGGCEDPPFLGFTASAGVRLKSWLRLSRFPDCQERANDVWGYVSPQGREYAILGLTKGTAFVEVTDPAMPVIVEYIDGGGVNEVWRDMAVYQEYAYVVSDGTGVGLQIIDLTSIDDGVVTVAATTELGIGFATAHNVAVNEESGFAYLVSSNTVGGIIALDLADPINPTVAGSWNEHDVHDLQVVSYTTGRFAGREVAYSLTLADGLVIIDVSDKTDMFTVAQVLYPNVVLAHQGWLSQDRHHFFIGDEFDEIVMPDVTRTTTYVVDVEDFELPKYVTSFSNDTRAVDHNMMVRGNLLFQVNDSSGLRVHNVCDVNDVQEIAFFDTHPEDDQPTHTGAWGVYSGLPSGLVLVSDRERGLFVFDVTGLGAVRCCDGDANGDNAINPSDTGYIQARYGCAVGAGDLDCDAADVNGDGLVDAADAGFVQARYGQTCSGG